MRGRVCYTVVRMTLRAVLADLFKGVFFFPVWWYSRGLVSTARFCVDTIQNQARELSVSIWLKNLFVPMYGSYDIAGRLISFVVRSAQVAVRSLFLAVYAVGVFILFIVYLVLPVVSVSQLLFQLNGLV